MRKITTVAIGAAMLASLAVTVQPAMAQGYGYYAPQTYGYAPQTYGYAPQTYGYTYNPYGQAYANPYYAQQRDWQLREYRARRAQYRYGYDYGTPPAIRCEQKRETNTAGGALIGALAGGLLGNSASHHDRGAGTAIGAIAGGVLGAAIGNASSCQNSPYGYYR